MTTTDDERAGAEAEGQPAVAGHGEDTHEPVTDAPPARPAAPELEILEERVYRGPNTWSYEPCVRLLVDLGVLEAYPTNLLEGFTDGLLAFVPTLEEHTCSRGYKGGFVERLREGTWLGHVAEHVALELQRITGADVYRGKTRGAGEHGRYHVIVGYADEHVGLEAGRLAVRIVNHLVEPADGLDVEAEIEELIRFAQRAAFGPSTQAIIDEAVLRHIPYLRLDRHSLVQLGHGVHQQRIRATMTSRTSHIAVDLAGDKELTNQLLADAGLPVPRADAVRSADGAVRAAERIGYPVVCKPLDGNHGRGVVLDLRAAEAVRSAFVLAEAESRGGWVQVESHVAGVDYRVLVVGGTAVAVAERVPAHVVGDGRRTIGELVEAENADPRRGVGHEKVLTRIALDDAAVALVRAQGHELDDVPDEGERVVLVQTANLSTGGSAIDRTATTHPENIDIAEEAARVLGLDIAGIDFVAPDLGEPVRDRGGAIVEVNAAPGFRMHTNPTEGLPQYVGKAVVDLLFPPGATSRIPILAVTGTNGKTTTTRMLAHILKSSGRKVGMTSTDGITIDGRLVLRADASGPRSARTVLKNPRVDTAVFEVARGGLLREGLGYDHNDVGVVLNVASDHLGYDGVETLDDLAEVKQVVVEAVPRSGTAVLNADDPRVAAMARACSGQVVYFSMDTRNLRIERHLRRGGDAVVCQEGRQGEEIVICSGPRRVPLAPVQLLPVTYEGRARHNVANALAATAAAHAAGLHAHDIRIGLTSFTPSYGFAPGRLNVMELGQITVIMDYAHNAAGLRALGEFVDRTVDDRRDPFVTRRRHAVVGMAGNRREEDMREFGAVAARWFDTVIVREDDNLRRRSAGYTAEHVRKGAAAAIAAGDARARALDVVLDEREAVRAAVERANPGDVIALCAEDIDGVWALVHELARRS